MKKEKLCMFKREKGIKENVRKTELERKSVCVRWRER